MLRACNAISDTPEILEGRDKCVLSDDEIRRIKDFVITNRDVVLAHVTKMASFILPFRAPSATT